MVEPGDWALLLPMPVGWSLLDKVVQKMTATDQLAFSARPAEGVASAEGGNGRGEDGDSAADPEDLLETLR